MIHENNKVALDEISPGNPFPSGRIDMRLIEIVMLINKVPSSQLSPEKIIKLADKIQRMSKEMKDIVNEWKEKV